MHLKKNMLYKASKRAEKVTKCSPCLHTVGLKKGYSSSTSLCVIEGPSFSRVVRTYSRSLVALLNLPIRQTCNYSFKFLMTLRETLYLRPSAPNEVGEILVATLRLSIVDNITDVY